MSISWHSFHVEDAIMAREHICSLCNVHHEAVTFSVQIIDYVVKDRLQYKKKGLGAF